MNIEEIHELQRQHDKRSIEHARNVANHRLREAAINAAIQVTTAHATYLMMVAIGGGWEVERTD